jgi:hypothetical protein
LSVTGERRLGPLKITTAVALGCGLALSGRLWVSSRLFPLSPVNDALLAVPYPLDYIWFAVLLGLLAAIVVVARPRKLILAFLALAVCLALWDQTRWQPWFYQSLVMLAALGFAAWRQPDAANDRIALDSCRLILVGTYVWSGLQKLNVNFVNETWPDVSGALLLLLPDAMRALPRWAALGVPFLEIGIGLGLLTRRYRSLSVILATATHLVVLALFISSGENTVIWPWNVAMIAFVWILFWRGRETTAHKILMGKHPLQRLVLMLFAVLPALSLVDLWDSYLSSALYSGNTAQAVIYVSSSVIDRLPAAIHPHVWQTTEPFFLDVNRWAYGELNVPVYPEPRVYRRIAEQICAYAQGSADIKLRINERPNPLSGHRAAQYYDCQHLR